MTAAPQGALVTSISCRQPGSSQGALQPGCRRTQALCQIAGLRFGSCTREGSRSHQNYADRHAPSGAWTAPARPRPNGACRIDGERALGGDERSRHACPRPRSRGGFDSGFDPGFDDLALLPGAVVDHEAAGAVLTVMLLPPMKVVYKHLSVI